MDELNSSFGRLSTSAPEWKPGGQGGGTDWSANSGGAVTDLNASKVKEFVPGQGWNSVGDSSAPLSPTSPHRATLGASEAHPSISASSTFTEDHGVEDHHESTITAGPNPPPPITPHFRALHSLGVSDDLWLYYRDQSLTASRQMDPSDPRHKAVPLPYCNAFCLDPPHLHTSRSSFGYPASTFQVTNREDGYLYCLRRFDSCRTVSLKIAAAVTDRWINPNVAAVQEHPNVVRFYQCFVAQRAVFFVHQYVPGAQTLQDRLLYIQQQHAGGQTLFPEPVIWSCVAQLVSAISNIHSAGLAVRSLDAAHVLVNDHPSNARLRIRINCLGIADALEFETRRHIHDWQALDMRALGKLVVALATAGRVMTSNSPNNWAECENIMAQNYSRELHNLAMTLLRSGSHLTRPPQAMPSSAATPPLPSPSIRDVIRAIWSHIQREQEETYLDLDRTSTALAAEYDSSRALRLLLKLGFVNERPEFGPNRRWSQSGDCYVLSLFRDYVFHQADGAGNPVMDLGHVITVLNKLDAADPEKIVLSSRDGISLMVVSYADVARCLESAFHEICVGSMALQY